MGCKRGLAYNIGYKEAVVFFLKSGLVEPHWKDNLALCKLAKSTNVNSVDIANLLLQYDTVDPCANNNEPLRNAIKYRNFPLVEMLLQHPKMDLADINEEALSVSLPSEYVNLSALLTSKNNYVPPQKQNFARNINTVLSSPFCTKSRLRPNAEVPNRT